MTGTPAVARAIARHKAALAAYYAAAAACAASPDEMHADDIASELSEKEDLALDKLAATPCAADAEFIEKLKCLIMRETRFFGSPFDSNHEFASIARAVALHFELAHDTA